jgi:DNA-binding CsgD family transcriptional regulator
MSYATLPSDVREAAERVLTRKQLDVFKLWCSGYGTARIATMFDISEPVARRHLDRARQKIKLEMEREVAA